MGMRFWRRVKIAPGLTLNLSKSGASLSLGVRGAHITAGTSGKRATVGIPGTGLFYTTVIKDKDLSGSADRQPFSNSSSENFSNPQQRLTLSFFQRMVINDDEESLVDGCKLLVTGKEKEAIQVLQKAAHIPDAAYLAGFMELKYGELEQAEKHLLSASRNYSQLGHYFNKYKITSSMELPVTDLITAVITPSLNGVLLGLVEVYQRLKKFNEAISCLERLQSTAPDDPVIKISLAELLLDAYPDDKAACQKIVRFTQNISNESEVHATLLLYKAKALNILKLSTAARDTLTTALRRKKNRSTELLCHIRYERALTYKLLNRKKSYTNELEKLYSQCPDFEDVAQRLGL
jgi:tetratricopeptide (TPR) repeat protein